MNTTAAGTRLPGMMATFSVAQSRVEALPWYAWTSVLATICISIGLYWDISWHLTIGRDTFWTPAHLLIQFGAVVGGIAAAIIIFGTTFAGGAEARESSVRVLGLWGPLGAFLSAWGAAVMVISAPFDNWWHQAYGLDVKILSPPHEMLGVGIECINFGGIILLVGLLNRAQGALRRNLQWMLLAQGGMILINNMMGRLEFTDRSEMHRASMYLALAVGPPFVIETISRATGLRWARTAVASIYTAIYALGVWVFPLFPAEPKLAPVYQRITHMIPLGFPVLLLGSAIALDLAWPAIHGLADWSKWLRRTIGAVLLGGSLTILIYLIATRQLEVWRGGAAAAVMAMLLLIAFNLFAVKEKEVAWNKWLQATLAGPIYVAALIAVQWPFGSFLITPAAQNGVFGTIYHPYMVPSEFTHAVLRPFEGMEHFCIRLALALFAATMFTRLGIVFGNWMRKVQR
jgi:hypothetical protein